MLKSPAFDFFHGEGYSNRTSHHRETTDNEAKGRGKGGVVVDDTFGQQAIARHVHLLRFENRIH